MKKTNKKRKETLARSNALEDIQHANPELSYEAVDDLDQSLLDFLELCEEFYWHQVKQGNCLWPADTADPSDNSTSHE